MAQPASAPPGSLAAAIERASALLATDPKQAGREAQAILAHVGQDPRALLILGSARRRTGDLAGARTVLGPLAQAYPRAALTQYELGVVLVADGQEAAGVAALRQAVALNRDLPEAWRALGERLFAAGDLVGAERAFAEHARAAVRDPALRPAADALFERRLDEAERLLRAHITGHPDDPVAAQMLGELFALLGRHADAEILLAHALQIAPDVEGARFAYAEALFFQQKAAEALPHVERLLATDPADPVYRNLKAACLGLIGEEAEEVAIYEALLADVPRQPKIWLNYGHALRTLGRRDESVAAYKRCIALAPALGDAYWSLANLKVAAFEPGEVAAMRDQLARPDLPEVDRLHLNYALGKALEDLGGDDAGAFACYAAGGAIRRAQAGYDADETTAQTRRSKALFTPAFFAARSGAGADTSAATPIFIVGLPRSGSTLVEQILASHPAVEGTMELPDIGHLARELDRPDARYPLALAELTATDFAALGEAFLERTRVHRKLGRPFFVDKMPNNFQHLGLIALALPGAKILDVRRHPLGCGFSAFKQHVAQGQAFSYDLTDLGRYYADYVELMRHMDAVLPGRVHRVIYEDLVADTEVQVRRLLDSCGLPFEAACLDFHCNERPVRTVSSEQVRRPIFRDGVDLWPRFEPWLDPLKAALGDTLGDWRS